MKSRQDDIGFAYVMQNQLAAFQYFLSRNYLEFESLTETDVNIYTEKNDSASEVGDFKMSQLRLIQRFPDEFSPDNYRNLVEENGHAAVEAETVVVTNSDYIVERLLGSGELCNISGADLSGRDPGYSKVKYTFPGRRNYGIGWRDRMRKIHNSKNFGWKYPQGTQCGEAYSGAECYS